jgi:hypothetical protein
MHRARKALRLDRGWRAMLGNPKLHRLAVGALSTDAYFDELMHER